MVNLSDKENHVQSRNPSRTWIFYFSPSIWVFGAQHSCFLFSHDGFLPWHVQEFWETNFRMFYNCWTRNHCERKVTHFDTLGVSGVERTHSVLVKTDFWQPHSQAVGLQRISPSLQKHFFFSLKSISSHWNCRCLGLALVLMKWSAGRLGIQSCATVEIFLSMQVGSQASGTSNSSLVSFGNTLRPFGSFRGWCAILIFGAVRDKLRSRDLGIVEYGVNSSIVAFSAHLTLILFRIRLNRAGNEKSELYLPPRACSALHPLTLCD